MGRQRFTPQPRKNDRYEVLDTLSVLRGNHQLKAGIDFNYVDHKLQALPLHFGGRYLFGALPAIPGLLPVAVSGIQAVALGIPSAYVQGYGNSSATYSYNDLSLFAQDDWRATNTLTVRYGLRYQNQFWPDITYNTPGVAGAYLFPSDNDNFAPRVAASWDPRGDRKMSVHGAYGIYYDNLITGVAGIGDIVDGSPGANARRAAEDAVCRSVIACGAGTSCRRRRQAPRPRHSNDPGVRTFAPSTCPRESTASRREDGLSVNYVHARGYDQLGTIDYNPVVTSLGAGRRPLDVGGVPLTSASVLQYTSFGETWYNGLTVSATRRFSGNWELLASYTLSKAEDNSTDFQSAFIPQDNGRGRDPNDPNGLPIGFNPDSERGPSLQDQRHRFVLSGLYVAPYGINLSAIVTAASGRPYNILAGADLNGDGDGGTIPGPDRARVNPADPATSIGRNLGTLPSQATMDLRVSRRFRLGGRASVDAIFEVFNLFNRANFTDINNIFGVGAYPTAPAPTFAQFQQATPPRQIQLAAKVNF